MKAPKCSVVLVSKEGLQVLSVRLSLSEVEVYRHLRLPARRDAGF